MPFRFRRGIFISTHCLWKKYCSASYLKIIYANAFPILRSAVFSSDSSNVVDLFYLVQTCIQKKGTPVFSKNLTVNFDSKVNVKLQIKASELKNFIRKNKFNSVHCFMVDMSAASGKQRFFCLQS